MKIKKILLFLSSIILSISIYAGDFDAFISINANLINNSSNYDLVSSNFQPATGVSLGISHKTDRGKLFEFLTICNYSLARTSVSNLQITSENGKNISGVNGLISNQSISLASLGVLKTKKAIYFGLGLSASILFSSKTKVDEYQISNTYYDYNNEKVDSKTFKNIFYSPVSLSIPVRIGFDLNRFDLFMSLNIGITNKLKKETFIKDYDNLLQIGVGYNFTKFK